MTGDEFKAIRLRLGFTAEAFALALAHEGTPKSLRTTVHKFESGRQVILEKTARLAIMFDRYGVPAEWDADAYRRTGDQEHAHAQTAAA